jgi:hypothetical protein
MQEHFPAFAAEPGLVAAGEASAAAPSGYDVVPYSRFPDLASA